MSTLAELYNEKECTEYDSVLIRRWNSAIRKELTGLSTEDICMFLRQKHFLDTIIPIALNKIEENPLFGELYDGEGIDDLINTRVLDGRYVVPLENVLSKSRYLLENEEWTDITIKESFSEIAERLNGYIKTLVK